MRRTDLAIIAALATASLGVPLQIAADGTVPFRRRPTVRKPGQPHAGSREIARRQRQEARRAERVGS